MKISARLRVPLLLLLALLLAAPVSPAYGEDAKAAKEADIRFMRVQRDDRDRPLSLDTAIVTYESAGEKNRGVTVELVGAVHVGDAKYYDELNEQFTKYEVLLYELVAPEGARIPKGGRKEGGRSLIGSLQGGMKSLLDLEHQLEKVDYTKDNFVHADMSQEEFAKSMSDRGESFLQMFLRAMGQSAAMQASGKQTVSEADILFALVAKDRPRRLKRLLAEQFEDVEAQLDIFQGPDGSTIITERNKKCFEVLQEQIDKGHKKIGVFYGAGHLPDMDKRLQEEFGMKRAGLRWVAAWDLTNGAAGDDSPKRPAKDDPASDEKALPTGKDADDRDPFQTP